MYASNAVSATTQDSSHISQTMRAVCRTFSAFLVSSLLKQMSASLESNRLRKTLRSVRKGRHVKIRFPLESVAMDGRWMKKRKTPARQVMQNTELTTR
jgi:hypothetical protein